MNKLKKSIFYVILSSIFFFVNNLQASDVGSGLAPIVIQHVKENNQLNDNVVSALAASLKFVPLNEKTDRFTQLASEFHKLINDTKLNEQVKNDLLQGNFENAVKSLGEKGDLQGQDLAYYHYQLAVINELRTNYVAALVQAKQSVQLEPQNSLYQLQAGRLLMGQKKYRPAIGYFTTAMKLIANEKSADQATVSRYLLYLGLALYGEAEGKIALKRLKQSLSLVDKDDKELLANTNFLVANVEKSLGNAQLAISHYQKAIEIDKARLGENHPTIAQEYFQLATAWQTLGKRNKVIEFINKSLKTDQNAYGKTHPAVALRLNNVGNVWRALGDYDKAIADHRQALQIDQNHRSGARVTAKSYTYLGLAYLAKGSADSAISNFTKALELETEAYGEGHSLLALQHGNLAEAWLKKKDNDSALASFQKALEITEKNYGKVHHEVASIKRRIGFILQDKGENTKAISYFKDALETEQKVFGNNHPMVTRHMNELGYALAQQGLSKKAETYHQQALQIDQKAYGKQHATVARDLSNLGSALGDQGQLEKATKLHREALAIDLAVSGGANKDTARDLARLGADLRKQGKLEESVVYQKKGLIVGRTVYGKNHENIAVQENNLGVDLYRIGESKKSKEHIDKAVALSTTENRSAKKIRKNSKTLEENLLIEAQEKQNIEAKNQAK